MRSFKLIVAGVRRELALVPGITVTRTPEERRGRAIPPAVVAQMQEDGMDMRMPLEVRHSGSYFRCHNPTCGEWCIGNVDQSQRGLCGACLMARSAPPLAGSDLPLPPAA